MKKYVPNFLTLFRISLVPFFIWFAFFAGFQGHFLVATIIFILASITDYYDGMLARRFKVVTDFGKLMDPLADKILIIAALIVLCTSSIKLIDLSVVIIIILREIIISLIRYNYAKKGIIIPANNWGKLKTVLQLTGIISALVYYSVFQQLLIYYKGYFDVAFHFYFWLVALVTIYSGLSFGHNLRQLKKENK
ncbi:MAG: CDP-diacylglycerol--glycerol-3-phosphate 3-phosphatidyltransferase [Candidatus Cloacimonadales bacterium]|nr:CDP-diacylglycerol--glycerol-3-phosphate 3-phosphatidyltransferase [Candidatus Cloacimonadales bacterium]